MTKKLLNECGLPINYNRVNHCFNDSTHHTCCLLGPEARKYADNSGNPIGLASKDAFLHNYGRHATDNDLTPWCTCSGSLVCSHYANMFNDGTKIKFMNNPNTDNEVIYNINSKKCEEHIRNELNINRHGTPGIKPGYEDEKKCNFSIYENTKKFNKKYRVLLL